MLGTSWGHLTCGSELQSDTKASKNGMRNTLNEQIKNKINKFAASYTTISTIYALSADAIDETLAYLVIIHALLKALTEQLRLSEVSSLSYHYSC